MDVMFSITNRKQVIQYHAKRLGVPECMNKNVIVITPTEVSALDDDKLHLLVQASWTEESGVGMHPNFSAFLRTVRLYVLKSLIWKQEKAIIDLRNDTDAYVWAYSKDATELNLPYALF